MKKIFLLIVIILIIGCGFYFYSNRNTNTAPEPTPQASAIPGPNDKPTIISTNPVDESILGQDQVIEVTFNRSLENEGEFKIRFEPEFKYKKTVTQDRKTAIITPEEPLELGTTFTLFVLPATKFDGGVNFGEEKVFHFKTIKYRGL